MYVHRYIKIHEHVRMICIFYDLSTLLCLGIRKIWGDLFTTNYMYKSIFRVHKFKSLSTSSVINYRWLLPYEKYLVFFQSVGSLSRNMSFSWKALIIQLSCVSWPDLQKTYGWWHHSSMLIRSRIISGSTHLLAVLAFLPQLLSFFSACL